jgi:hemophore-related protein
MTSSCWLRRVAYGGLITAASLSLGVGTAAADPNSVLAPLVNTTCSYAQITAALNVEAPDLSSLLNGRPQAQSRLKQFLALPVDQRQQRIDQQLAANPQAQAMINAKLGSSEAQEVMQVVNTCSNY